MSFKDKGWYRLHMVVSFWWSAMCLALLMMGLQRGEIGSLWPQLLSHNQGVTVVGLYAALLVVLLVLQYRYGRRRFEDSTDASAPLALILTVTVCGMAIVTQISNPAWYLPAAVGVLGMLATGYCLRSYAAWWWSGQTTYCSRRI